jgi:glutamine cyclotransferase
MPRWTWTWAGVGAIAGLTIAGARYAGPGSVPAMPGPIAAPIDAPLPASVLEYDVVRTYPHDPHAVTQGLIYYGGYLYESTGAHGAPSLRQVALETGTVVQQRALFEPFVGEGLTEWHGVLVQLTPVRTAVRGTAALRKMRDLDFLVASVGRRLHVNFGEVCDLASLRVRATFTYQGEGWGLTHDGRRLILSDGTAELRLLDPRTFAAAGSIAVTDRGKPVALLNELEYVDGRIYANVWRDDRIAIIDPSSARVSGWLDLSSLWSQLERPPNRSVGDVLNGIAYDRAGHRLFVTGKRWPRIFEIRVRPHAPRA